MAARGCAALGRGLARLPEPARVADGRRPGRASCARLGAPTGNPDGKRPRSEPGLAPTGRDSVQGWHTPDKAQSDGLSV